uniref:F-box and leucine-rich protein 22 n=1 Tax=Saimiri boliviensis boliviensis TaxID=39432 RepID=A0A2K6V122_SAIBB
WPLLTMHITQLNRECLLHLFSFLDKDSRKSLARTCSQLHEVFEDPALWSLLHFRSLTELQKDNFLLGPALRSLSICWHSSRVQVCSIEDWLKSAFQRSICSQHESLVNDFLLRLPPQLCAVRPQRQREKSPRWGGPHHSGARAAMRRGLESLRAERPLETQPAPGVSWGPSLPGAPGSDLGEAGGGKAGCPSLRFASARACLLAFAGTDEFPE